MDLSLPVTFHHSFIHAILCLQGHLCNSPYREALSSYKLTSSHAKHCNNKNSVKGTWHLVLVNSLIKSLFPHK